MITFGSKSYGKKTFFWSSSVSGQVSHPGSIRAHEQSGLSIQAFCVERNIATGNFHRWKKQYNQEAKKNQPAIAGFSSLQLKEAFAETLFAEFKGIRLYQPVSASYLKELVS
jgi:hypothetical protein